MQFKKTVLHYFAFLKDYGFKMRGCFIKGELGAESFVFRKKDIKLYVDFYPFNPTPAEINNVIISWKVFVNIVHNKGKEVNILNSKVFSKESTDEVKEKLNRLNQVELENILTTYSDFVRENINLILNLNANKE